MPGPGAPARPPACLAAPITAAGLTPRSALCLCLGSEMSRWRASERIGEDNGGLRTREGRTTKTCLPSLPPNSLYDGWTDGEWRRRLATFCNGGIRRRKLSNGRSRRKATVWRSRSRSRSAGGGGGVVDGRRVKRVDHAKRGLGLSTVHDAKHCPNSDITLCGDVSHCGLEPNPFSTRGPARARWRWRGFCRARLCAGGRGRAGPGSRCRRDAIAVPPRSSDCSGRPDGRRCSE